MNHAITFFVGCVTFVIMFLVKIPIKKCSRAIAERLAYDDNHEERLRRRINLMIYAFTILVSLICYYQILSWLEETHVKLCCALKGSCFAVAFYAIYEQWFGEGFK